jgi:hypothetical protein
MSCNLKSYARQVGAVGAGLVLVTAAALPLAAQADESASAPTDAVSNMIVVRDAQTGKLRAATAAETRALMGPVRQQRSARLNTVPRYNANGARGARLSDDMMSYSVVVRQPNGGLTEYCFANREEAEAAMKGAPLATNNLPTE